MEFILPLLIGFAVAAVPAGVLIALRGSKAKQGSAQASAAAAAAEERVRAAKVEEQRILAEAKREEQQRHSKVSQVEERVLQREQSLERKLEDAERERKQLIAKQQEFEALKGKLQTQQAEHLKQIDVIKKEQLAKLEKVASLPKERAEALVMELTEQQMKDRVLREIKKHEEFAEKEKDRLAKRIIAMSISRLASEVTTEHSTSKIELPNAEMKGRIIGREGRNIKHLEQLLGVELLVDEQPNAIVVSGFNAIRRYVAKLAIEQLIQDGRIHPGHIEETVIKAKKAVEKKIKEAGEAALREVGIRNYHPQLAEVAGRLLFRTSYGQNQLKHAVEVATIAGLMAVELGCDVQTCKSAGFLHDIGKAIDHDVPGTHVEIGDKLLRKFGFSEAVIRAAETHHETVDFEAPEDWIVAAADAVSSSRPGARRNTTQEFVNRVKELENIAKSFEGVENCYAIEAGREIRVMVQPELVDDLKAKKLAHAIADRVESELTYPGQIKVAVIREIRAVDYARYRHSAPLVNIIFIGDVIGKPGRQAVARHLPELRKKHEADFVIANGENLAHGKGATRETINELISAGVDLVTSGNHWADQREMLAAADDPKLPFIRPANYPLGTPGRGYKLVQVRTQKVLVINLMGRTYFKQHFSDPFRGLESLLKVNAAQHPDIVIVDFHADATGEAVTFGYFADGLVTAVLGTHTHVPTADAQILPKKTGYVTDVGMVGPRRSALGLDVETAIEAQRSQLPYTYKIAEDDEVVFNYAVIKTEQRAAGELAKCSSIERLTDIVTLA
ncbi:MAG: ribonuclease Y [Candidatus Andersenbacteria bacterium]